MDVCGCEGGVHMCIRVCVYVCVRASCVRLCMFVRLTFGAVRVVLTEDFGTQYDEALLGNRFHINSADDHGNTLLTVACQNGRLKIAQLLIKKGANPDHQNVRVWC